MKKSFMKDVSFLSYYQSSLRNIIVFTTLAMAFVREAVVYRDKNNLYNVIYLFFSLVFLSIATSYIMIT